MKVLVLYRPDSEFSRSVEEFVKGLQTQHNIGAHQLQVMDIDSREGAATASMYDIMSQPGIVITGDDGAYVKHWEGANLPLLSEVAGYTFAS